jgi:hypothetical protein
LLQLLPPEIVDQIAYYLPYEKGTELSLYLNKKLNGIFGRDGTSRQTLGQFAYCGNLFRLQWMHFHENQGCTTDILDCAAMNGHLEIVKWLH